MLYTLNSKPWHTRWSRTRPPVTWRWASVAALVLLLTWPAARRAGGVSPLFPAHVAPRDAIVYHDFSQGLSNLSGTGSLHLGGGLVRNDEGRLEFTGAEQYAESDAQLTGSLSERLQQVEALSVGGWFYCRRSGEQVFLRRGNVRIGSLGERFFPPNDSFVNFCLGTDQRGFLMGTIHGNGQMPFVHVTINDLPVMTWQQLVVVKDSRGFHHFYQNGCKVHDDSSAQSAPSRQPWRETSQGGRQPLRLEMPMGGMAGEVWVVGAALDEKQIAADYGAKRQQYRPAPPGRRVAVRPMHSHPDAGASPLVADHLRALLPKVFGSLPRQTVPLEPQVLGETDCGSYIRRHVSIQVQPQDRMPAYVLVPKGLASAVPAIICFYGTTAGAGKSTTVGMSGRRPGDPPHSNLSFALDMVRAGFVAFAPDYLRDGQRIHPGDAPYDTTRFYQQFPDWSIHGKDIWDTMRAIDYLQTLPEVDAERIGMVGHSYGGHSTIFAAAWEPRIKVAVANGPVSAFREHGMHWAVPPGARNSQSLPAMRPYILDPERPLPITFAQITALIAPRPLLVGQAAGERRPREEENVAEVQAVFRAQQAADRVEYIWYAGDHDFPPEARAAAVEWFRRWLLDGRLSGPPPG